MICINIKSGCLTINACRWFPKFLPYTDILNSFFIISYSLELNIVIYFPLVMSQTRVETLVLNKNLFKFSFCFGNHAFQCFSLILIIRFTIPVLSLCLGQLTRFRNEIFYQVMSVILFHEHAGVKMCETNVQWFKNISNSWIFNIL